MRSRRKKKTRLNDRSIEQDFTEAQNVGQKFGFFDPLGRLDTTLEESVADPNSLAYAGRRSDQGRQLVESLQNQAATAGNRSSEMAEILNMMRQGLAGLTAQENTGIREQAQRELDRRFQNEQYALQKAAGGGRLRGGALASSLGDIGQRAADSQSELEQDLLVKNIDIQDQRRNQYQGALGGQEDAERNRTMQALGLLGSTLGGLETNEWNRGAQARAELRDAKTTNLEQGNKQQASRIAALSGLAGYGQSKRSLRKQFQLAQQGLRNSGGGSRSPYNPTGLTNAISGIIDQQFGPGTSSGI